MKKRLPFLLIIVVVLVIAFYFFYLKQGKKDDAVSASGIVEGIEVNIAPKIPGMISDICCNEGDIIEKGQVIVRLQSDDLKASVEQAVASVERAKAEVKVAEANVEAAKANIQNAEAEIKSSAADVERAQVRLEEAERELNRADSLLKEEIIAKELYDRRLSAYDSAVAELKSSKARLDASYSKKDATAAQSNTFISHLNSSKARLKESMANLSFSKARLNDTIISSPITGTLVYKAFEKGEIVSPGTTILTIVDTNNLYARIDVEETSIGLITLDGKAIVRAEGIPDKAFEGIVSEIGRHAEFATQRDVVRGRQDIKTFRVKIKLPEHGGLLKPGMTVLVEIPKKS